MTVRRLKTYTAESGRVYEYYFVGKRPALKGDPYSPATEYVFDIVSDRQPTFAISIFMLTATLQSWQADNGRGLTDPEQYGAAKMKLFRVFDQVNELMLSERRFPIEAEELKELLLDLGVD
jgi:hypothetical protein